MTKEEMLRLLTAAYTGPGSAAEGTFAGDVLRACADGMAQLWSMEIDGLERRAFVSSAVGEWLTAVCADRGCVRKEGETDEELRARTLAALAATPASGNADHYAAWCGQAADILRVKVLPLARGNGTVDIVVGTHRLLSNDVKFKDLGLVIIDEEQRFGVKHKEKLKQNFIGVDMLTLSATPIPRTLNMALSGIRDMSTIEQPPFESQPIETLSLIHI